MGLRTITLKLYKPGKGKREILDRALENYNKAFEFLLKRAYEEIDDISGKYKADLGNYNVSHYNARAVSKWVGEDLCRELNQFDVQPFKDSLKFELGMTLASYLELREVMENVGFPDFRKMRPVYFCRYDIKRSYSLLYDAENGKYYVKLYLLNARGARAMESQDRVQSKLRYIFRDSRLFEGYPKRATYIILPLSFGKYQESFLKDALKNPDSLRTAKLLKKGGEYYLAVSIETGKNEGIKTGTYMGVARGLGGQLSYTILEKDGKVKAAGAIDFQTAGGGRHVLLNELHRIANDIVVLAQRNQSQVIVQNLSQKGDNLSWTGFDNKVIRPLLNSGAYIKLSRLLEYKLPEKGLPEPVQVSPAGIFHTCSACGYNSRSNRLNKGLFLCTRCGSTMDIEKLGSLNLAGRLIAYSSSKIKVRVQKTSEGVWFKNKLLGLELLVPNNVDHFLRLKSEINTILDNMKKSLTDANSYKSRSNVKKAGIIRKLESSEDFMDLIELVQC